MLRQDKSQFAVVSSEALEEHLRKSNPMISIGSPTFKETYESLPTVQKIPIARLGKLIHLYHESFFKPCLLARTPEQTKCLSMW